MGWNKRVLFSFALGLSSLASAYPQFISYGYESCNSCHYNPLGNGPLTDYGRAVSATAIAGRRVWGDTTDEEIAERSSFIFQKQEQTWFRPSINYRGLGYRENLKDGQQARRIVMDLGGSVVLKTGPWLAVAQLSYEDPQAHVKGKNKRSREHYVGWRVTKEFGVYAGLMDKAFGVRVADHIAYSRMYTRNAQDDQSHGVLLHYAAKTYEVALNPFVGHLQDQKNKGERQQGYSLFGEYTLASGKRVGASVLRSESDYSRLRMYALHTRLGLGEGKSVLAEVGEVQDQFKEAGSTVKKRYLLGQGHFQVLTQGLFLLGSGEYGQADLEIDRKALRLGLGLQIFPMQRLEFRADVFRTSVLAKEDAGEAVFSAMLQSHLWL